uniref:Uncharacterized protein n=1 Tax=uncultured bacterium Ad_144_C12_contig1 TaxID=1489308 RepID=A0A0B4N080_9BACT|nr:putative hypothetical protein Closa_1670 [uncultured bacterium Ad_144_C12_contig1]
MHTWPLDRQGFVNHYLVSGPRVTPFSSGEKDRNQLRLEAHLRSVIARHAPVKDTGQIHVHKNSRLSLPWRFQGGRDGAFVNLSEFYATMQRIEFDVVCVLHAPRPMSAPAVLWSYAAVDLYCNGAWTGSLRQPVYKPMGRAEVALPLQEGRNVIYLACETLGVRDTRSVVGLQLKGCQTEIRVSLPDEAWTQEAASALDFLENAVLLPGELRFCHAAPPQTEWAFTGRDPDFAVDRLPTRWHSGEGSTALPLPEGKTEITLRIPAGGGWVQRTWERTEQIHPRSIRPAPGYKDNLHVILERIAAVESLSRGAFGFPIANMLARKALNKPSEKDDQLMQDTLDLIERRVDCADFLVCGLIRFLKNYAVGDDTARRIRRVLTHFRYWMDQEGFDGMCFWSENHSLMFFSSAMLAGEMYPDDEFPLAKMTGRQLYAWGRQKVLDWLSDVERHGFEEFLSTVYMCITFAVLINVVDYAEEGISLRAAGIADRLLQMLALHTFKGGIIAPQGRVYRGVLYPFQSNAMALMNLADPSQPYDYGEGWLGFYATSRYRLPGGLKEWMERPASLSYVTGNARIVLEKHRDWCLTSVQSPREPFDRWKNIAKDPHADPSSLAFVKSYNECFHGTTCFQPGVSGYQQHLWYAALDGEAIVFINHPGAASEGGDMRPGYWHGNGIFPALKQQGAVLGMIYRIPENHPLQYVHLYCPECRFDEVCRVDDWLLLRKGNGLIGLWSSVPMEPWQGMNVQCEQRMWGSEIACLCVCAGKETEDMDAFRRQVKGLNPHYQSSEKTLTAGDYSLTWRLGEDDTQAL